MIELDFVRWRNSTAETCKMTKFVRTENPNWLSVTEIKVEHFKHISFNYSFHNFY